MEGKVLQQRRGIAIVRLGLAILLLIAIILAAVLISLEATQASFAERFEKTILSMGMWGVLASILLMILHSLIPFPAELLAIANGMIYGPIWGTVITWTGAMCGAYLAFALARALGRPFVELMIAKKNWHSLDERASRRGAHFVFFARFVPVISFNLINYAAGLTKISWWSFTWATGLGILPLTALMVVMGDRIETITWEMWLLFGLGAIVLWVIFRYVHGRLGD